jgi:hypothetical protein
MVDRYSTILSIKTSTYLPVIRAHITGSFALPVVAIADHKLFSPCATLND